MKGIFSGFSSGWLTLSVWVCRRVSTSRYKMGRLSRGQKRLDPTQDEVFHVVSEVFC